jgi:hypothetical protein
MIRAAFVKSYKRNAGHASKSRLTRRMLGASLKIKRIYSVLSAQITDTMLTV